MLSPRHLWSFRAWFPLILGLASGTGAAGMSFVFEPAAPPPAGVVRVAATNQFSPGLGWGFDLGQPVRALAGGGVTSDRPCFFSVALPEGDYLVTATFGGAEASTNTVKAEARRLMIQQLATAPGQRLSRRFGVNLRTPDYPGGRVHLKPREHTSETLTWDDKLTLEFDGPRPALQALVITPAPGMITVFLAGDSTVCDQPLEPWNSWGQMLPRFFDDRVAVANYAESGETLRSSLAAHRFDKIFSCLRPGDFLLLQFGHNDMKSKAPDALAVYQTGLEQLAARTRSRGATPVLVTSMERKAGVRGPTLAGYPDAVRRAARATGAALIDLNAASLKFYRALGPDLGRAFQDGTHHDNYGSYELARCVVEGIRQQVPRLAVFLDGTVPPFDPAHPDPVAAFQLPASPFRDKLKPEGN